MSALAQGCVRNTNPFQMCFQTIVHCAQVENGCLLGSLQLPYGVDVRLEAVVVPGPVGLEFPVGQQTDFLVTYSYTTGLFVSMFASVDCH